MCWPLELLVLRKDRFASDLLEEHMDTTAWAAEGIPVGDERCVAGCGACVCLCLFRKREGQREAERMTSWNLPSLQFFWPVSVFFLAFGPTRFLLNTTITLHLQ